MESFSNVVIGSTKDFGKFRFVGSNRTIKAKNVSNLMKSFKMTNGMMKSKPIIVDGQFNVIDGQHRLEACKRLNIPVHYIVTDEKIENIPIYNAFQEKWGLNDYARYYSNNGNQNYTKILEISEKSGTSIDGCMESIGLITGSAFTASFKEGRFVFDGDIDKCVDRVQNIKQLCFLIKKTRGVTRKISRAIRFLERIKSFTLEDFIEKVQKYPNKIYSCATSEEYIDMFIQIYNYRKVGEHISELDVIAAKNRRG